MIANNTLKNTLLNKRKLVISFCFFLIGWLLNFLIAKLIWKQNLISLHFQQIVIALLIPVLILGISWFSLRKTSGQNFALQYVLLIFLIVSFVNIFILHFMHIQIYGDYDQLPVGISKSESFPRWLIGSSILTFIYNSIILPVHSTFQSVAFVRFFGSFMMLGFSIYFLIKYQNRLTVILPFFSPIWFLFSSGYNEYYPFIAEAFIFILLMLSENYLVKLPPVVTGVSIAAIMLLYAGFVPFGLFLLFVLFFREGARKGMIVSVSMLVSLVAMILVFWHQPFTSFFPAYYSSLNIKASNLYPDQLMMRLPFFKVGYAFSRDNITRIFNEYFWSCGFGVLLILVFFSIKKFLYSKTNLIGKNILFFLMLIFWQLFYFVFMVPRLGAYQDIDLFFTVYLLINFLAGYFCDLYANTLSQYQSMNLKFTVFSFFLGNSSFLILYFCFLGIPYFK